MVQLFNFINKEIFAISMLNRSNEKVDYFL